MFGMYGHFSLKGNMTIGQKMSSVKGIYIKKYKTEFYFVTLDFA